MSKKKQTTTQTQTQANTFDYRSLRDALLPFSLSIFAATSFLRFAPSNFFRVVVRESFYKVISLFSPFYILFACFVGQILSVISAVMRLVTSFTHPITISQFYQIGRRKWMSLRAMGFSGVICDRAKTSQAVFLSRYSLKMNRVTTDSISAQMVNLQFWGNQTYKYLVSQAVDLVSFMIKATFTVAASALSGLPFPTRNGFKEIGCRYFNMRKQTRQCFAVCINAGSIINSHFCLQIGKFRSGLRKCNEHFLNPFLFYLNLHKNATNTDICLAGGQNYF